MSDHLPVGASTSVLPSPGCRWCGVPRYDHDLVFDCDCCGGVHREPAGHKWLPPTRAQRERRALIAAGWAALDGPL